jgi:hypothetical protein
MVRCLELFSGTGSVGKVARELGWEVVSLDICPKDNPTHCIDILAFDFSIWSPGYFDVIWASPPCTLYSIASHCRDPEGGNAVSRKTMEVINLLNPTYYIVENPHSSLIWKQGIFEQLPKKKVSYCHYGFPYRKNTQLATNVPFDAKACKGDCPFMVEHEGHRYHQEVAQHGRSANTPPGIQKVNYTSRQLYQVPPALIHDICAAITQAALAERVQ